MEEASGSPGASFYLRRSVPQDGGPTELCDWHRPRIAPNKPRPCDEFVVTAQQPPAFRFHPIDNPQPCFLSGGQQNWNVPTSSAVRIASRCTRRTRRGMRRSPRRTQMAYPFFTIGHSTRPVSEFADLLKAAQIDLLADVRSVPRSRTNPQYNCDTLPETLAPFAIGYEHIAALGGLRARTRDVSANLNAFWENRSFRSKYCRCHSKAACAKRSINRQRHREMEAGRAPDVSRISRPTAARSSNHLTIFFFRTVQRAM
jgi:Protein of unknown function, DUF488